MPRKSGCLGIRSCMLRMLHGRLHVLRQVSQHAGMLRRRSSHQELLAAATGQPEARAPQPVLGLSELWILLQHALSMARAKIEPHDAIIAWDQPAALRGWTTMPREGKSRRRQGPVDHIVISACGRVLHACVNCTWDSVRLVRVLRALPPGPALRRPSQSSSLHAIGRPIGDRF